MAFVTQSLVLTPCGVVLIHVFLFHLLRPRNKKEFCSVTLIKINPLVEWQRLLMVRKRKALGELYVMKSNKKSQHLKLPHPSCSILTITADSMT